MLKTAASEPFSAPEHLSKAGLQCPCPHSRNPTCVHGPRHSWLPYCLRRSTRPGGLRTHLGLILAPRLTCQMILSTWIHLCTLGDGICPIYGIRQMKEMVLLCWLESNTQVLVVIGAKQKLSDDLWFSVCDSGFISLPPPSRIRSSRIPLSPPPTQSPRILSPPQCQPVPCSLLTVRTRPHLSPHNACCRSLFWWIHTLDSSVTCGCGWTVGS